MLVLDVVSVLSQVVLAGAAVWGAMIAARGLRTWRDQLRGGTEYDLARRVLGAAIDVRESINRIRLDVMAAAADSAEQWTSVADAWATLRAASLEAEVVWGKGIHAEIEPLQTCMRTLRSALRRYVRATTQPRARTLTEQEYEELDAVIYDRSEPGNDDAYTTELSAAVDCIETYLRPHLAP